MAHKFSVQDAISGAVSNSDLPDLRQGRGLDGMLSQRDDHAPPPGDLVAGELTPAEQDRLDRCETVIERGLRTFMEVGSALAVIRNERLYRAQHATFEDYCRQRWDMGRNYVNKLVTASEIVTSLGTTVPKQHLPANEAQVRPLSKLKDPEQQRQAWERALERAPDGKITGDHVEHIVNELLAQQPQGEAADPPAASAPEPTNALPDLPDLQGILPTDAQAPASAHAQIQAARHYITHAQSLIAQYGDHMQRVRGYTPSERNASPLALVRALEQVTTLLDAAGRIVGPPETHTDGEATTGE